MSDRNQIKWLPFNSITTLSDEIKNIRYERKKVNKPTLCDDKLESLNYILKYVYENKEKVLVEYYNNGFKLNKMGTINIIKNNKVMFEDKCFIYINQILNIKIM